MAVLRLLKRHGARAQCQCEAMQMFCNAAHLEHAEMQEYLLGLEGLWLGSDVRVELRRISSRSESGGGAGGGWKMHPLFRHPHCCGRVYEREDLTY